VKLSWDQRKRDWTLAERRLDFADADQVFAGLSFTLTDDRRDYGEPRFITAGHLRGRLVILVWTPRGEVRHIISMRKANDREKKRFAQAIIGKAP
jgi:uncharacterized DUF497 family protein